MCLKPRSLPPIPDDTRSFTNVAPLETSGEGSYHAIVILSKSFTAKLLNFFENKFGLAATGEVYRAGTIGRAT